MEGIKLNDRVQYAGNLVNGGGIGRVVRFESDYLLHVVPEDLDGLAEAKALRSAFRVSDIYYRLAVDNIVHIFSRSPVEAMLE